MNDTFRGDNAHMVRSIEALLNLDAAGALAPHGIGGHARELLESAAVRLLAPEAQAADMCRMHGETLQRVGSALGLSAGANVHLECVPAIEALLSVAPERWLIARETVISDVPDSRPLLGYTVFADPFTTFRSAEDASEVLQELKLPLGWVRMKTNQEPWASLFPAPPERPISQGAEPFQPRVKPWLLECFGEDIAADREERNHRFLEESLELVQACGCTASEAHQLVDYTFGRPVGQKAQEVGGVMVTLAALCLAQDIDMHAEGETELARISVPEIVAKIRAKQAAKPKHSPLPAEIEPVATGDLSVLDDDLIDILGRPNFTCIRLAQALRLCGVEIKTKAEHEQAAVIHFLLTRYMRHGSNWSKHADADLRIMLDEAEAKNKAAMTPKPGSPPLETGEGNAR